MMPPGVYHPLRVLGSNRRGLALLSVTICLLVTGFMGLMSLTRA